MLQRVLEAVGVIEDRGKGTRAIPRRRRTIISPSDSRGRRRNPSAWDGQASLVAPHPGLELGTSWCGVMCYDGWAM